MARLTATQREQVLAIIAETDCKKEQLIAEIIDTAIANNIAVKDMFAQHTAERALMQRLDSKIAFYSAILRNFS